MEKLTLKKLKMLKTIPVTRVYSGSNTIENIEEVKQKIINSLKQLDPHAELEDKGTHWTYAQYTFFKPMMNKEVKGVLQIRSKDYIFTAPNREPSYGPELKASMIEGKTLVVPLHSGHTLTYHLEL